jgi:hypothetical protein
MSEVELLLAFLAGVLMEGALDRFVLPLLVDAWIDRLRRHGDERGDDADQRRADVYSSARNGQLTLAPSHSAPAHRFRARAGALPFVDPPADVAPQADRPRQHARRRFAGEAVLGLRRRHQPRW